ncbi:hypothetical protein V9T40_003985 [Parthenolecanium corni]|uniref:Uncharacterized protein n=1 Tax=Parthenolecanium corni TaxID=536013 RepID=A0AAN9TSC6_9HEMI
MAYQSLTQEYLQMPPVTRAYTTACVLTTTAVQLDIVSPFQLYFNPTLILKHFHVSNDVAKSTWKAIFDNQPVDSDYNPLPEDRPGGFDWGENEPQPQD